MAAAGTVRVVSLFCGCGGMDLGFRGGFTFFGRRYARRNVRVTVAVDSDPEACSLYRLNVGEVVCARVGEILDWPRADIVIGGPPCQPFSAAGRGRGVNDERNALPEYLIALRQIAPRAFLLENVAALGERRAFAREFAALLAEFRALGFRVEHAILDAADFGVPQHRRRLFIVGVRDGAFSGSLLPTPPRGTNREAPTVRDAIADLHVGWHDRAFRALREGERRHPKFGASSRRVAADRPFPTIKAADTRANRVIHPWFDRFLTMPELLRAQSFPDDFIVPRRTFAIGNAVPPVLAWHVARSITGAIRRERE